MNKVVRKYPQGNREEAEVIEAANRFPIFRRHGMKLLRDWGWQYERIGQAMGVTRQCVHQTLAKMKA
jgi:hypothetical protein